MEEVGSSVLSKALQASRPSEIRDSREEPLASADKEGLGGVHREHGDEGGGEQCGGCRGTLPLAVAHVAYPGQ